MKSLLNALKTSLFSLVTAWVQCPIQTDAIRTYPVIQYLSMTMAGLAQFYDSMLFPRLRHHADDRGTSNERHIGIMISDWEYARTFPVATRYRRR